MAEIIVIDIETENTGYDVMKHNKRILSIQTYDGNDGHIYYDDSDNDLSAAKDILNENIESGKKFVGFNVRNFDVRFIKEFLQVDIPSSQIIDIGEMPNMQQIKQKMGKDYPRLVDVCDFLGIECSHKNIMDNYVQSFRDIPEVISNEKDAVTVWEKEKPWWSSDYAYNRALNSIAIGMSILKSFNEFVDSNGSSNSLFYKYAMGDVYSEYALYEKVK